MKKNIIILPTIFCSALALANNETTETERLVVSLKQSVETSSNDLISNASALNTSGDLRVITVPKNEVEATIERLKMESIVENVEIDPIVKNPFFFGDQEISGASSVTQDASDIPSDPELKNQFAWNSRTDSQAGYMDLLKGFQKSYAQKEIRVGVIDAGFHLDSDIDWEQGYNFSTRNGESQGPEYLEDYYDKNCSSAHGSAVGQIIAAKTDNYQGIAGAVKAKIYPVRSMSCGLGYLSDAATAIRWLAQDKSVNASITIDKPVDIINMSLGGGRYGCPSYMQNAVNYAYSKGIAIFVSAGNDSKDVESVAPASCDNVFTVASVGTSGYQSSFTNYGDKVDASALGEQVRSYTQNGFKYWYGTSFSSPNAAAIGALALQANPTISVNELFNYLKTNSYSYKSGATSNSLGSGIINASLVMDSVNKDIGANKPVLNTILSFKERVRKEAYKDATFIDDKGDIIKACSIFEIDTSRYETPIGYPNKTLFSAPQGQPLTLNSASQVASSIEPKFIEYHLRPDQYDYALGYCDSSGSNCSQDDFIKLEDDKLSKQVWCEG